MTLATLPNDRVAELVEKGRTYRDALIKIDELSKMLGETLRLMRVGWDSECVTEAEILGPLNQIAKQIGEAIPPEIKMVK